MNPLEQINNEVNSLKQTNPVRKEIQSLGLKVLEIRSYEHNIFRTGDEGRGHVITATLDDICLEPKQLESIIKIGIDWISVSKNKLEISLWRKEI